MGIIPTWMREAKNPETACCARGPERSRDRRERFGHLFLVAFAFFLLLAFPPALHADNVKLYLKDGTWQLAREYKVEGDRVSFYSVERSEWEELPLDLVDLKKTESEISQRAEADKVERQASAAEDKAEREMEREIESVPKDPGVYYLNGKGMVPIKQGESKMVTDKGRKALKILSPIPAISDKMTLELDGAHSSNHVDSDKPEFYIRLSEPERFALVRMGDRKGNRVVEKVEVVPVSKEEIEKFDEVELFQHQVRDDLFKLWPMKPLEPGEYAVVEYTEGKVNTQVWDFSWAGKTGPNQGAR
jgi:hypothetical protein